MAIYKAKARVVKVSIGSPDGNRVARIVHAGGIIPEGVHEDQLKSLVARNLIEVVDGTETSDQETSNAEDQLEKLAEAVKAAKAAEAKAKAAEKKAAEAEAKADESDAKAKAVEEELEQLKAAAPKTPPAKAAGAK